MKALIVVGDSDSQRRCDSKCYDATSFDCNCVCQGINHGAGLARAEANTERFAKALVKEYEKKGEQISIPNQQERLFNP